MARDAPWVISGRRHHLMDLPKVGEPSEQSYLRALEATEPKLGAIFALLGARDALPILLHCVTGRDRAGLIMALVLLSLGVPSHDVAVDFSASQDVGADPKWLNGVFARIHLEGGIDRYLAAHQVAAADLDSLRAQALE